jgi:hypothetical protein
MVTMPDDSRDGLGEKKSVTWGGGGPCFIQPNKIDDGLIASWPVMSLEQGIQRGRANIIGAW